MTLALTFTAIGLVLLPVVLTLLALAVWLQMPLCRLVEVEKGLSPADRARWQNKVDRKTVDYVICDAGSLRPRVAVELDGTSHDRERARARDGFVEAALADSGVALVRFDRRAKEWDAREVAARLAPLLDHDSSGAASPPGG